MRSEVLWVPHILRTPRAVWAPQTGTPFRPSPMAEHSPKHQALAGAQMSLEGKVRGSDCRKGILSFGQRR